MYSVLNIFSLGHLCRISLAVNVVVVLIQQKKYFLKNAILSRDRLNLPFRLRVNLVLTVQHGMQAIHLQLSKTVVVIGSKHQNRKDYILVIIWAI